MKLAFKLIRPQGQRSELILCLLALIIAMASVSSVSLVADRLNQALQISSRDFIAADRVIRSSHAVPAVWLDNAKNNGLTVSTTVGFRSMLFAGDRFQLASVRGVDGQYPLRGTLELDPAMAIQPGQLWLSPQLMSLLSAKKGDVVDVGDTQLTVAGTLVKAPDAGFSPLNLAPAAMIHIDDVAKANVIQPGSRVSWRYLFAGNEATLNDYGEAIQPLLTPTQKWYGATQGDTPVASPLQRAARFFTLAALIGVLLGALAMGITLRHYAKAQLDTVALLKTLGASSSQIMKVFWSLLGLMLAAGTGIGLLIGWGAQLLLLASLGDLVPKDLPLPSVMPLVLTVGLGCLLTFITAFAPLAKLLKTPPLRVLRKDISVIGFKWTGYAVLLFGPLLLVWLMSGDLLLSAALLVGLCLVLVLVGVIGWGLLMLANHFITKGALHLALQRLRRHRLQSMTQLAGMATSLLLMALIINLQDDLAHIWQKSLPAEAPNRFMVNIAPLDVDRLHTVLASEHIEASDLVPMLRGRMTHVNGQPLAEWFNGDIPERMDRERNLTWLQDIPNANQVVAGAWWQDENETGISLEQGYADSLNATLGDTLTFSIDGRDITATITSIRTVTWETMQPNFFVVFSPNILKDFSATFLASFYLPPSAADKETLIVRQFPSASVINVETLISQLDSVIGKVSKALTLMVIIVVLAAVLVMLAILQVSMKERQQELVLMRTLGAQSWLMRSALRWELVITGVIAGIVAVIAVESAGWILTTFWLDVPVRLHYMTWWLLPTLGACLSVFSGSLQVRPIVNNVLSHRIKVF